MSALSSCRAGPGIHGAAPEAAGASADRWTPGQARGDGSFADAAVRLAGLAAVAFGWRPDEFWGATPDELAAPLRALVPEGEAAADAGLIARLQEAYPDG